MRVSALAILLAVAATSQGAAVPQTHVVHEKREVTSQWIKREKLPSRAILPMRVGLKQQNLHRGEELLMDV